MTPSNLTVRNITSGVSRRHCCSNATATSSNFINVETIPNTLTNSIQTMWQPLRHIQTSILRSRIRMLSQVNSKLTCIVDECPVDNTVRDNTSIMLRCNSARCASTLCLIDSLLVIDTITLSICSACCPGRLFFNSIEVSAFNLVYIRRGCCSAESISSVECAVGFTDSILGANTRILQSACRNLCDSCKCSCSAKVIKLLQNRILSQFDILVKCQLKDVINLLIQSISNIEFGNNICRNNQSLTTR